MQLTLSIEIMQVPLSVAIMQVLKFYWNYVSGTFLYSYVGRSFCCIYAVKSFCSKYVDDDFFFEIMHVGVSVAIMQVIFSAVHFLKKKNIMVPFLWMRFNYLKARPTLLKQFTFSGSFWYSFYRPWKDERSSRPWIHPVNLGAIHYADDYFYCNYAGDYFCWSYVCDSFM